MKEPPVKITVNPPTPHSKKQRLIMTAFRIQGVRKIYVACGTKFGKSVAATACMTTAALERKKAKWRWIAPIYDLARVGMDYFKDMLPPEPHTKFLDSRMRILLPRIQSEIQFWHCMKPTSLEGAAINGNIFDEAAKCPFEAVVSATTTTTMTKAPQMYISTPFGKNHFYKGAMDAKAKMEWAIKNGKPPTEIFIQARTLDNPFIDPRIVEEARKSMPERLWRQYYLAEFVDDGSVFIGFRSCIEGPLLDVYGGIQTWIDPLANHADVAIGVDWAKKEDFTVFTAIKIRSSEKPKMVGFMRFQGLGYVEALKELYGFIKKFKNVVIVKHDRTGVGEAIDDMMAHLPVPFEGVVFTNNSKAAMVNQLMLTFESGKIILPNWSEMISELESYTVVTNVLGNARYSAPQGMHDDIVSSLMLANAAATDYASEFSFNFLEDLPTKQTAVEKWYSDLMDDDF